MPGWSFFISALCLATILHAQPWEPVGGESFEAIAGVEDGSLLLVAYPGTILRSTDTGVTWSEVYRGSARLSGFGRAQHVPTDWVIAYGDSGYAIVSLDSGRTWNACSAGVLAGSPFPQLRGPAGTPALHDKINSYAFAGSLYYAVGEPGLMYVWDTISRAWRELHRAPYAENPVERGVGLEAPTYAESGAIIDFSTPACGAIALGNRMFFTYDSGVTWRETVLPDTNSISSFFLLSDTATLIGMIDGRLYYWNRSVDGYVRCDSILYSPQNPSPFQGEGQGRGRAEQEKSILQIGWKDAFGAELFVLTDSELYSLSADLHASSSYDLPLRPGERAVSASFPNPYVGFLLTDSVQRIDTITTDGRDTTMIRDTSYIYRSLDGGATWTLALKNIPGLTNMFFVNVKRGFACGANGLIMVTNDSGTTWGRAWSMTKQNLRSVRFVNDSIGYAVGDSGTVLLTQNAGRMWRPVPPEPIFTHPTTEYTSIAFPNPHTVYIISHDRGDKSTIKIPASFRINRRRQQRATLSVSARPDPSAGEVTFDIRLAGTPNYGAMPELKVCDMSGKSLYEASSFKTISTNEWNVDADLTSLQPGPYTALVTIAGQTALAKFLIQH